MHFSETVRDYHSRKSSTLIRPRDSRVFAGVCAGLANHLNLPIFWTRFFFVVIGFVQFPLVFLFYIIAIFVIPCEKRVPMEMACDFVPPPPPAADETNLVESEVDLETLNQQFDAIEAKIRLLEDHVTSKEYILRRKFEEL